MHYMQSTRERREHFSLPLGFGRAESPKRLAIVPLPNGQTWPYLPSGRWRTCRAVNTEAAPPPPSSSFRTANPIPTRGGGADYTHPLTALPIFRSSYGPDMSVALVGISILPILD